MAEEQKNRFPELKAWIAEHRPELQNDGVAVLGRDYHGSGDEGQSDEAYAYDGDGNELAYSVPEEAADLLDAVIDDVGVSPDGDGGGGSVKINVADGVITHESYYYETSSVDMDTETY